MRDGGAYGCAVPRAYANLNPGLMDDIHSMDVDSVRMIAPNSKFIVVRISNK